MSKQDVLLKQFIGLRSVWSSVTPTTQEVEEMKQEMIKTLDEYIENRKQHLLLNESNGEYGVSEEEVEELEYTTLDDIKYDLT